MEYYIFDECTGRVKENLASSSHDLRRQMGRYKEETEAEFMKGNLRVRIVECCARLSLNN